MHSRPRRILYAILLAAPAALVISSPADNAAAIACPSSADNERVGVQWYVTPSENVVHGYRARINLRTSGNLCTGNANSFVSPWIGVYGPNGSSGISQIGWGLDDLGYCKFWEYNNNEGYDTGPMDYQCGTHNSGDMTYFKVHRAPNSRGEWTFVEADCGTDSTYTNCNRKSSGPLESELSPAEAGSWQETNFGGLDCPNVFMGSASAPTLFGGTDPIQGQGQNDNWGVRVQDYYDFASCRHYASGLATDDTLTTYDDRN